MTQTLEELVNFLTRYNLWRRGDENIEMPEPKELGLKIDEACKALRDMVAEIERLKSFNEKKAIDDLIENFGINAQIPRKYWPKREDSQDEEITCLKGELEDKREWFTEIPPPKNEEFYIREVSIMPCRWKTYKPQARKQGCPEGRWQVMNEYGGWDNYDREITEWKPEAPRGE